MKKSLNFHWFFKKGAEADYKKAIAKDAEIVDLPHNAVPLSVNAFDESLYLGEFSYWKEFEYPFLPENRRLFIVFQGAMLKVHLYLNNVDLGEQISGYLPIEFELSKYLKKGKNLLYVHLINDEDPDIPPFGGVVDYLSPSGIYRPVYLEERPSVYVEGLIIQAKKSGELSLKPLFVGETSYQLKNTLYSPSGEKYEFEGLHYQVENVDVYSTKTPHIYHLISEFQIGDTSQIIERRIGFRDVEFRENGFYLNGEKLFLIGANRHQDYPYIGMAATASLEREEADLLKLQLGVNIVRTSHYPQSEDFLTRLDELGILYINEVPGWQHIGASKEWRNNLLSFAERMVLKENHHPSLIAYGTRIDESKDDHELYTKILKRVHELDPSRQTIGVRNFKKSECLEDIYGYNDFRLSSLRGKALSKENFKGRKKKPLLITEHNGHMFPTKSFDRSERLLEQGLRHLKVIDEALSHSHTSGVIGWSFADYHTHRDFGSGDKVCYHGLFDLFRNPKPAAYAYLSQSEMTPVMEIINPPVPGDNEGGLLKPLYIFTNCDYIEFFKGENYVNTFYPNHKKYKNLKHPPIIIDDFVGALLKDEGYNAKDGEKVRRAFTYLNAKGLGGFISPLPFIPLLGVMLKKNLKISDFISLYQKHVNSWGEKSLTYHFKGYRNGTCVLERQINNTTHCHYSYFLTSNNLQNEDTYDTTTLHIKYVDENDNLMRYANRSIKINLNGPLRLLGPDVVSLIGGSTTIYIASLPVKQREYGEIEIVHENGKDKLILAID